MEWRNFITLVKEHYKGSDRVWYDKEKEVTEKKFVRVKQIDLY